MDDDDPFTQVYNALWSLYEQRLTGDKIKYNFTDPHFVPRMARFNEEHELTVILVPETGSFKLTNSSSGSGCVMRFTWMFKANDVRITSVFFPKLFALYRALVNHRETVGSLEWQGKRFAKILNDVFFQTGVNEKTVDESKPTILLGWTGVISHDIQMFFTTADLVAE